MAAQRLDLEQWPRREVYRFFSGMQNPFYMVTFRLDVTELRAYTKQNGLSFYYALVWLCTEACNEVEAFRLTLRGGEVWRLDRRDPSFTDLAPGSEVFHIVTLPAGKDLTAFCRDAARKSRAQTGFIDAAAETGALIYFSCLPWVELTALTNERDADPDDAVPRIAWGRYAERDGRLMLGLSLEVNHRLIDGVHIGRFAQALERRIAALAAR